MPLSPRRSLSPETRQALLLFAFFFIVIAVFWIQKPIRSAKFLAGVGVASWPLAKLATALATLPLMLAYSGLAPRVSRRGLVALCAGGAAAAALGFRALFAAEPGSWIYFAYFVFVDLYATVMVALFWSLANDLTGAAQARRSYGFVGAGGILGGFAGSSATGWLAGPLGIENLLLLCAGLLALLPPLARALTQDGGAFAGRAGGPAWRDALAGARAALRSRYLLAIVAIVACYELVSNIVDYQFMFSVSRRPAGELATAEFIGRLSSAAIAASAFFQLALTTWLLRRHGPRAGLLVLPAALAAGSLVFLGLPALPVAAALYFCDGSLHYSVNQTSKEVLYTPTDEATKYQAKAFIDMLVFRVAKGASALLIVGFNAWLVPLGWRVQDLSLLSLLFLALWLAAARAAARRFHALAPEAAGRAPARAGRPGPLPF